MGGAPALYLPHWKEVIDRLAVEHPQAIFHSDLLLTESVYKAEWLEPLLAPHVLLAVDIKGVTAQEYETNTRKPFYEDRFWHNLNLLNKMGVDFYITFTNVSASNRAKFWSKCGPNFTGKHEKDSFTIDLIDYEATAHVDDVGWGKVLPAVSAGT